MSNVSLKGHLVHLIGKFAKVGEKARDFKLTDSHLKDKSLADFQGKKKIIATVPSLDTPTCSLSAKKFNEAIQKYPDCVAIFVSADLPFAQARVCGAEKMSNIVTLSMMRSKKFGEDWGVLIQDGPLAGILARSIVVLDENDRVLYTELVSEISHEPEYEKALSSLKIIL